jgi:hypothetical protein
MYAAVIDTKLLGIVMYKISQAKEATAVTAAVCTVCTISFVTTVSVFLKGLLERARDNCISSTIQICRFFQQRTYNYDLTSRDKRISYEVASKSYDETG